VSNQSTDILIIGSGPGGSTTAHLLAERGREVLMVEDGLNLPLDSCKPFSVDEMVQKYRAGGLNPALGTGKVAFVEGRVVGGGSEINSGLYHRTPPELLERWKKDFLFDPGDLTPHFEYNERGLEVQLSPVETPLASRKLMHGATALGWRAMEVPRWFSYHNGEGKRNSMSRTYVPRALAAGARLQANTRVSRLRREGSAWVALTSTGEIRANHVFVSCGAIQTPLLLRRSGITKCVGDSLALHPTVKVVALFPEEVNNETLGVPVHQVKEFSPRISFGCSIASPPHLALALSDHANFGPLVQQNWRHMAIYYAMITGPNTGTIRAVGGSLADPVIRYEPGAEDWRDLATGMRHLSRLLLAGGATRLYPCVAGLNPIDDESQLSTIPGMLPPARANAMTIHLFSSCPTGEAQQRCAADSWGCVHGAPNLHIADASLIPTSMGVNPQGTVMALAHRNALNFLGDLS